MTIAGVIRPDFDPLAIAEQYHQAGASALSVLTDRTYFQGRLEYIPRIKARVPLPVLRKDFIIDEYQVWEARAYGADAILLMASLHVGNPKRLARLFNLAASLGMDSLVEIGMAEKSTNPIAMASIVPEQADIWGITSRRFHGTPLKLRNRASRLLKRDFTTSNDRHEGLRNIIPPRKIAVAESGVADPNYLSTLAQLGYKAALIGTAFLKQSAVVENVVAEYSEAVFRIRETA